MNIKLRLIIMSFFQFYLDHGLTIGAYWFQNKQWSGRVWGWYFYYGNCFFLCRHYGIQIC
jgi:NHS family xanthosine MFS transporter